MRQAFRPYTLAISNSDLANGFDVDLVDTAGNPLECNYISLQASGSGATQYIRMSANFPNLTTPQANFESAVDQVGTTLSGVPAVYTVAGGEPATMILSDSDRVSSVNIKGSGVPEGSIIALVTYGQVSVGNNLRDQERPRGN